ncbi:MAG: ankyrin repeat domain-containing protein [Armatimonadetes bacterium]|nr:ankyrin repeat domain-containing protein [Armatimonadota bacterium]
MVESSQQLDSLFREAVALMDQGDVRSLQAMLSEHPNLATVRLEEPGEWLTEKVGRAIEPGGFFERPYLLWFVAEDPVRCDTMAENVSEVASAIITAAQGSSTLQEQLDHALRLVSWSWVARKQGTQIGLLDVLLNAGGNPLGNPENALVNGNVDAARHLIERGAPLSLASALCLDRTDDVELFAAKETPEGLQFALVLSALNGNAAGVAKALDLGAKADQTSKNLYPHGTPLHHAVCSGSLDTVRALVDAGADLRATDTAWQGTPRGWAEYYVSENREAGNIAKYRAIAEYLKEHGG